jgi:hypothetical protein
MQRFIMKRLIQVLLLVILAGCSAIPNLPPLLVSPTPVPASDTPTPSVSDTPIPTQNLFATATPTPLTFTPTVTALGAELFTPTSTETNIPTAFPTPPRDAESSGYFTPQNTGFQAILTSGNTLYWDAGPCTPRNIKISAFVDDPLNTYQVMLFLRVREKKNTLNVTDWGAGALMIQEENGSFNYNIRTFNIRRYYYFVDGWIEYQLVAVNDKWEVIGRTRVYDRDLSLVRCRIVP